VFGETADPDARDFLLALPSYMVDRDR
jgi:hypothetical protein